MSKLYPVIQIVRGPLCYDSRGWQHIGKIVIPCKRCGAQYAMVHATLGNTGEQKGNNK